MSSNNNQSLPFPAHLFITDEVVSILSNEELGTYYLLLYAAWNNTEVGTLLCNDAQLAQLGKISLYRWQKIKHTILKYFELDQEHQCYTTPLMQQEYQRLLKIKEQRRFAGSKGMAMRWNKYDNNYNNTSVTSDNSTQFKSILDAIAKSKCPS